MCILVGLSQFCGWFRVNFVLVERFLVKMVKTGPSSGSARLVSLELIYFNPFFWLIFSMFIYVLMPNCRIFTHFMFCRF